MQRNRTEQETMRQDSNTFLRREGVLRTPQPVGYQGSCELSANRETIEAIIQDSADEQTRQYILRRIRDVSKEKTVPCRLDRVCSLLFARYLVHRI